MNKEDLLHLIEGINTKNPGKELIINFLNSIEGKLDKETAEMVIYFSGMLINHDEVVLKADAFDILRTTKETHEEQMAKIKDEIIDIGEQLNPTATG